MRIDGIYLGGSELPERGVNLHQKLLYDTVLELNAQVCV